MYVFFTGCDFLHEVVVEDICNFTFICYSDNVFYQGPFILFLNTIPLSAIPCNDIIACLTSLWPRVALITSLTTNQLWL